MDLTQRIGQLLEIQQEVDEDSSDVGWLFIYPTAVQDRNLHSRGKPALSLHLPKGITNHPQLYKIDSSNGGAKITKVEEDSFLFFPLNPKYCGGKPVGSVAAKIDYMV